MIRLSGLLLLTLFTMLLPAYAQDASHPYSRFENGPMKRFEGLIEREKLSKNPVTPEQIDEALDLYDDCKAQSMLSTYYDCDCMSSSFLELRRQKPDEKADILNDAARKMCANKTYIAGDAYKNCTEWASSLRDDYREYCTCYANGFATNFGKTPTDSIRGRQVMMTNALNACRGKNEIARTQSLDRVIDYLKRNGMFNTMFPGSVPENELSPSPNR